MAAKQIFQDVALGLPKVKFSGPGLQREPQGQLGQVTHVGLFASLLDIVQSFHLERTAPARICLCH